MRAVCLAVVQRTEDLSELPTVLSGTIVSIAESNTLRLAKVLPPDGRLVYNKSLAHSEILSLACTTSWQD